VSSGNSGSHRFSALWQLTLARWRGFFREPSALFWSFGFPLLLSTALGIAFRNRPPEPVFAAVESRAGADDVRAALSGHPDVRVRVLAAVPAFDALRTGRVAIVVVPGTPVTYQYDATRPESRVARLLVDEVLQRRSGRNDARATVDSRVTAPGARYIDWLIPGLIGLGLMSSGLWGIGFTLVDMRTRKLIKRLVATPMRRSDFLASFVVMRSAFVLIEVPILLVFARVAFGVGVRGSVVLVLAIALLGGIVFAGLGLLAASRAENTQTVSGLINIMSLPMFLLSGVFFPSERFPDAIQPVVRALPLSALNSAMRSVMIDGAVVAQVAVPLGILVAWSIASFVTALAIFRWR